MVSDKVLVAYATRAGSTAEVAEFVGKTLREAGATVDVRPIKQVKSLSGYGAVVVGSAIRIGKLMPEAYSFLQKFESDLAQKRVAYFIVCLTMHEPTEENCKVAAGFAETARQKAPRVQPLATGLFAGAVDYDKLTFPWGFLMKKMVKAPAGDFRDWDAVKAWTLELAPQLRG